MGTAVEDWDRPQQPGAPRRLVAVGAFLALAVVGGLFVRAGAVDRPGGALDVDRGASDEDVAPEEPAVVTPSPADGSEADGSQVDGDGEPGVDGGPGAGPDESGGELVPDGKAQGELLPDGKAQGLPGAGDAATGGEGVEGAWEVLPDAPIAGRAGHTLAWSGDEMLAWGGMARNQGARGEFFADGAAYSPSAERWRALPPAPLDARSGHGAAWTGTEFVVWGGTGATAYFADGAAYDPAADAWRPIAPSPLSPRQGPATVWTGEELLVLGGSDTAGPLRSAAAYAPAEDSWRELADLPEELAAAWEVDGAWLGDTAVVWAQYAEHAARGARYEPASDRWSLLPPVARRGPVTAAWTGEELLAFRGSALEAWRPGQPEWEQREAPKGSPEPWASVDAHWTGEHLVVVRGADRPRLAAYDPGADSWAEGPELPVGVGNGPSVWTGTALLTWGGSERLGVPGHVATGAAYRPRDGG